MYEDSHKVKFSLKKFEILRSKRIINEVFEQGSSFFDHPLKIFSLLSDQVNHHQVLITVPKKNFKNAVQRNKVKRIIREAYRLNKHLLESGDNNFFYCIAIIYISKDLPVFWEIQDKLNELIKRLNKARSKIKKSYHVEK